MQETPVHDIHNDDLLKLFPSDLKRVLEVGCSSGALAREYKKVNAACHYTGLEINGRYAELAQRYCDDVLVGDIELLDDNFWSQHSNVDCWVFADVLEHLKAPGAASKKCVQCCPAMARSWPAFQMFNIGASQSRLAWVILFMKS